MKQWLKIYNSFLKLIFGVRVKMSYKNKLFILATFFLASCSGDPKTGWEKYLHSDDIISAEKYIDKDLLFTHISTLSSDQFEGRKPATKGGKKTVQYLIDSFKELELKPGNPNGTWFQDVKMLGVQSNLRAQFITEDERWVLKTGDDIIGNSYIKEQQVNLERVDVIFCGYGVTAPEYKWDDYKDVDVKDKVVIILVNDPPIMKDDAYDNDMFKGKAMTYYGRWSYKYEEALRRGAAGAIVIHETGPAGYPFSVLQAGSGSESLTIEESKSLKFQGWLPLSSARKLFSMSKLDFASMKKEALSPEFQPKKMDVKFTSRIANSYRNVKSKNVVAKYEGSDPFLKDEYIIYTAHWDHLGVDIKLKDDKVFNGANDNALGTAMVLAAAKSFTQLKLGTKRSILFLLVTAEEDGLLGSKYYSMNPLYPLDKTLAVINVDAMGNTFGKTKDLIIIGKGNSNLDSIVESAAKQDKKYVLPDAEPEKGFYYRSDHFAFAKMGVPSLYVDGGIDVRGKGKDFGKSMKDIYTKNHYHSPSDEIHPDWIYDGVIEDNGILLRVGYSISQNDEWPSWNENTEFKSLRDAMLRN